MAQNAAAHPGPGASALPPFEQLAARRTAKVAEIETALANGKSTKLARENLRDIDRKQAAVLAEEAAASTKQLAERGEQLDKDSLQLTDQALARVRDALVQPDHPPPGIRLEERRYQPRRAAPDPRQGRSQFGRCCPARDSRGSERPACPAGHRRRGAP
jgi:hypothetical protein